jgi:hypothetical protein
VSNYHAYADAHHDLTAAPLRVALNAIVILQRAVLTAAGSVRNALVRRWTRHHIARLSDHMLRDFGFERDWDGSIRSIRDAD